MFAERLDALMKIAEVSNTQVGRAVNIDSSHIGRLRSGARPLPKKHDYIESMCQYLARHITHEYQITALQKLTGISNSVLTSQDSTVSYLEQWLLMQRNDTTSATGRLVSGFSRLATSAVTLPNTTSSDEIPSKYASYLYGNAGKRKAVEQFFLMILKEKKPQTLLLFSDENFSWLYEDPSFSARWAELFTKILLKGNRVHIIHTVSRDMNELLEAVTKWLPIYMTGAIEPFYYPRLRDGIFQRTMFIAPHTAAVISSSVQQNTEGMLNLFITDSSAIAALVSEYKNYFSLCRPLMHIFTKQNHENLLKSMYSLSAADGNAGIQCTMPPLFAMPEVMIREISEQIGNSVIMDIWKKSISIFRKNIKRQKLSVSILDPDIMLMTQEKLTLPMSELFGAENFIYSREQYLLHFERLNTLQRQYENLTVTIHTDLAPGILLYVKEDTGALISRTESPLTTFILSERTLVNAFWDYIIM